jgi:hypothetical protein
MKVKLPWPERPATSKSPWLLDFCYFEPPETSSKAGSKTLTRREESGRAGIAPKPKNVLKRHPRRDAPALPESKSRVLYRG